MKNYVSNGRVAREEIAADIRDGIINRADIKVLASNPEVKNAFIGQNYARKVSRDKWTREYLDTLTNAVVAEAFNEDYLNYLADVSEYVRGHSSEASSIQKYWPAALVAGAVVIGLIIFCASGSGK